MRELIDQLAEIAGLAKIAVDRGEADVGHVIQRLQPLHDELADALGGNLRVAGAFELTHDAVDHALDALGLDRALAQRNLQRTHDLFAVERHPPPRALHNHQVAQLHPLERREPPAAIGADPPPPNRGGILGRPRILHLRVE